MDFGIISLGNHAMKRVIPAILESGSRVTAIHTRDRSKGEKVSKELGAEFVPELEGFMKRKFEAAYISSPNYLHFNHTKMCLESGKSVLLEKPVTLNIEESETLAEISTRENLRLNIGFHLRFHPAIEEVKRYLSNKKIGEPRVVYGKFTNNTRSSHNGTWWDVPEMAGGGSIVGRGVHIMDSFVNLFGRDVESISASNVPKCGTIEDTMQVSVRFRNGVLANSLSSVALSPSSNDLQIFGDKGSVRVTNFYATSVSSTLLLNDELKREFSTDTNMYVEEIKAFVGGDKRIASAEDGVVSTKMHLLAQRSACEGTSIPF